MTVNDIIERVLDDAAQDIPAAIAALEDGEYLARCLPDAAQAEIEAAYAELENRMGETHA